MRSKIFSQTIPSTLVMLLAACGGFEGDTSSATETATDEEALSSREHVVTLRRDLRRCAAPMCGGYFATAVNGNGREFYVSRLDFSRSGLDDRTVDHALEAEDGELVVRGRLGERGRFDTRPLIVREAFRGLPGVSGVSSVGAYYQVSANDPPIMCITAPCNNLIAHRIGGDETSFTRVEVERALLSHVDAAWLQNRVESHDAVVLGELRRGERFPGGHELVLDATQIFLKLPELANDCPMAAPAHCPAGQVPVADRNEDRCILPAGCVEPGFCTLSIPVCEPGYELVSWASAPHGCPEYACDPLFTLEGGEEDSRCSRVRCAAGYHCEEDGPEACVPDVTCAVVLCGPGTTCVEGNGTATCVPELTCAAVLCRRGTTCVEEYGIPTCVPQFSCASVLCAPGTFCVERHGEPVCLPRHH